VLAQGPISAAYFSNEEDVGRGTSVSGTSAIATSRCECRSRALTDNDQKGIISSRAATYSTNGIFRNKQGIASTVQNVPRYPYFTSSQRFIGSFETEYSGTLSQTLVT
jgi:hypothetical protein